MNTEALGSWAGLRSLSRQVDNGSLRFLRRLGDRSRLGSPIYLRIWRHLNALRIMGALRSLKSGRRSLQSLLWLHILRIWLRA